MSKNLKVADAEGAAVLIPTLDMLDDFSSDL